MPHRSHRGMLALLALMLLLVGFTVGRVSESAATSGELQAGRAQAYARWQCLVDYQSYLPGTRIATFGEVTDLNVLCPKLWEARRSDPVPDFGHPDGVLP